MPENFHSRKGQKIDLGLRAKKLTALRAEKSKMTAYTAYAKITNCACPEMTKLPKPKNNLATKAKMSWPSGPKRMSQPYKCKITFNRVS